MPRPASPSPIGDDSSDYESRVLRSAGSDAIDWEAVRAYLAALDAEGGGLADGGFAELGPEGMAARVGALGLGTGSGAEWHPTTAGLLLFGRAPHHLLPQVQVKAARFRGSDVAGLIVDRAEIGGAVGPLIEAVTQFVTRNMRVGGAIEGVYRRDVPEYPVQAVREAVTNAIAHRDYSLHGQKVQVRMFDDRLEIESPGGLAGPVTLDTLELRRFSRNPRLAQAMYLLRLVEEMGTGIRRIKRALADLGSGVPTFRSDPASFLVRLPALDLPALDSSAAVPQATPVPVSPEPEAVFRARSAAWLRAGLSPRQAAGLEHAEQTGRLTNREYREIHTDLSDEAARLDLADLVERGYLMKIGSNRGTYYILRD
ncbi:MAG TPA: ATP-binding protein [Chloroflexia bacterium]|nr:ATP-binding protein [Chloroflexia bacterium]